MGILEHNNDDSDGPIMAKTKKARGPRGNANNHSTTQKGKGKAAKHPQGSVNGPLSNPMLTSLEEDNRNGDGPNWADIDNARGPMGNVNSHAKTQKGKGKGKGKATKQP